MWGCLGTSGDVSVRCILRGSRQGVILTGFLRSFWIDGSGVAADWMAWYRKYVFDEGVFRVLCFFLSLFLSFPPSH